MPNEKISSIQLPNGTVYDIEATKVSNNLTISGKRIEDGELTDTVDSVIYNGSETINIELSDTLGFDENGKLTTSDEISGSIEYLSNEIDSIKLTLENNFNIGTGDDSSNGKIDLSTNGTGVSIEGDSVMINSPEGTVASFSASAIDLYDYKIVQAPSKNGSGIAFVLKNGTSVTNI